MKKFLKNVVDCNLQSFALSVMQLRENCTVVTLYIEVTLLKSPVLIPLGVVLVDLPLKIPYKKSSDGLFRFGSSILQHIKFVY